MHYNAKAPAAEIGKGTKIPQAVCLGAKKIESGDVLLSRAVASQVPSACGGLTSVFGMGTGGTLQLLSPETFIRLSARFALSAHRLLRIPFPFFALFASFAPRPAPSKPHRIDLESVFLQWLASFDQALDLLVSASYIRYRTSTADLSTSSSLRGLTYLCSGSLILQGGFTLRCLQRLSRPHFASLLCPWQNNSFTRGASIPVLSY